MSKIKLRGRVTARAWSEDMLAEAGHRGVGAPIAQVLHGRRTPTHLHLRRTAVCEAAPGFVHGRRKPARALHVPQRGFHPRMNPGLKFETL